MDNHFTYAFKVRPDGTLAIQGGGEMNKKLIDKAGSGGILHLVFEDKSVKGLAYHYETDLLPQFKKALLDQGTYRVEKAISKDLWKMSSVTQDLQHDNPYKLDFQEAIFFIAELRQIAAEAYNFYLKTYND